MQYITDKNNKHKSNNIDTILMKGKENFFYIFITCYAKVES